jgi:hypothetical protein
LNGPRPDNHWRNFLKAMRLVTQSSLGYLFAHDFVARPFLDLPGHCCRRSRAPILASSPS